MKNKNKTKHQTIFLGTDAFNSLCKTHVIDENYWYRQHYGFCSNEVVFGRTGSFYKTTCNKYFFQPDSDCSWDIYEVDKKDMNIDEYSYPI